MLNSTKTWQEELRYIIHSTRTTNSEKEWRFKKLIDDIRKKDEEELIKTLPKYKDFKDVDDNDFCRNEGYNGCINDILHIIQQYYAKN